MKIKFNKKMVLTLMAAGALMTGVSSGVSPEGVNKPKPDYNPTGSVATMWLAADEGALIRVWSVRRLDCQPEGRRYEPDLTVNVSPGCSHYLTLPKLMHRLVPLDRPPCCVE